MRFIKKRLLSSDVFTVAGGSVIAQGVTMAFMPVLSRIYSPEDFGVASSFAAVMSMLIPLSSLRYFLAIALPRTQRYAAALVNLSFAIQIVYFFLLCAIFALFGNALLALVNMERVADYKILIPFGVLGASIYEMLTQCAIRGKLFPVIARTKISQSAAGGFTKLVMGAMGARPLGLIAGTIIGQAGGITSVALALRKINFLRLSKKCHVKRAALRYRNFPLFATPAAIVNTGGTYIIPLMVFGFYGAHVAGLFSIAHQLLAIPSVFVGSAIGQVFLQRASAAKYNGALGSLTWNTYKRLMKIGVFPTLLLVAAAPYAFQIVLGSQWFEAGIYARLIAPVTFLSFAFSPISQVFNIQSSQRLALILECAYFFAKVLGFYIGVLLHSAYLSILLYSLGGAAMVGLRTFWALKIARR